MQTFLKIFDYLSNLTVNIWVAFLQIIFGIGIGIELIFVIANLLTAATLFKEGLAPFSGILFFYYNLFVFIPFALLLLISSLFSYLIRKSFWSTYKKAYYYLSLYIIIAFSLLPLSFYICTKCRG